MRALRATIILVGLATLLAVAGAGAGRATEEKAAPAKNGATKSTNTKSTTPKAGAKGDAAAPTKTSKDKSSQSKTSLAGHPASPALKDWLAKAGTDSFFLVLDPKAGKLELVLGGVVMRSFEVAEVQVATPRRLGRAARLPDDWHERVWTGATLDPPHPGARTEIVGPEIGAAETEVLVPPTPEEAIPVPDLFRLRFVEGLAIEITGGIAEQKGELPPAELPRGFKEKIRMLREGAPDPLRLRIRLKPEAASELYRSLPPGTDFVVLHSAG